METDRTPSTGTGKILRACQSCSKSKAKCIPQTRDADDRCARCFRLGKDCVFLTRGPRRKRPQLANTTASQLEQKIETLAALLVSQQKSLSTHNPLPPSSPESSNPNTLLPFRDASTSHMQPESHTPGSSAVCNSSSCDTVEPSFRNSHNTTDHYRISSVPSSSLERNPSGFNSQVLSGDKLLQVYREEFSPRFPFVQISDNTQAREVQSKRPWLYRAITIIVHKHDRVTQLAMAKQTLGEIAIAMLVSGQSGIDFLQCLLVLNTWYIVFIPTLCSPAVSSTALNQLLLAAVFDIALHRPVRDIDLPAYILQDTSKSYPDNYAKESKRPLEERRTLLSVYFTVSLASWSLKQVEALQYSPYIEYCCQRLLEAGERDQDYILVALVKLQSIVEGLNHNLLDSHENAPLWMHIKRAQIELRTYWNSLPQNIQQDKLLFTNYQCVQLGILESCLQKSATVPSSTMAASRQLDNLHSALIIVGTLLEQVLDQPMNVYVTFSAVDMSHIGYGIITLFKLTTLNSPGWDLSYVRQTVNLQHHLERAYLNFAEAGAIIDGKQPLDRTPCFQTLCSRKIERVNNWFNSKFALEPQIVQDGLQAEMDATNSDPLLGFEQLTGEFWEELLGESNFLY